MNSKDLFNSISLRWVCRTREWIWKKFLSSSPVPKLEVSLNHVTLSLIQVLLTEIHWRFLLGFLKSTNYFYAPNLRQFRKIRFFKGVCSQYFSLENLLKSFNWRNQYHKSPMKIFVFWSYFCISTSLFCLHTHLGPLWTQLSVKLTDLLNFTKQAEIVFPRRAQLIVTFDEFLWYFSVLLKDRIV